MAARIPRLGYFARQCTAVPAWYRFHGSGVKRPFSFSAGVQAKDETEDDEDSSSTNQAQERRPMRLQLRRNGEINSDFADYLGKEELEMFKSLSDEDINVLEETTKLSDSAGDDSIDEFDIDEKLKSDLKLEMRDADRTYDNLYAQYLAAQPPKRVEKEERAPEGFFNLNEAEDKYGDEEEEGDISSLAHGELEKHREEREYARLAAWEMPMLSSTLPSLNSGMSQCL